MRGPVPAALHRQRQGASLRARLAALRAGLLLLRAKGDDRVAKVEALLLEGRCRGLDDGNL